MLTLNEALARSLESMSKRMEDFVTNEVSLRRGMLQQFFDPRRNVYDECGYPRDGQVTLDGFYQLYRREAIAARIVQIFPKESWQVHPEVYEVEDATVETPFERDWRELGKQLLGTKSYYQDIEGSPVWEFLRRADELSGIGRYGVILLGIDDGKRLSEPVDGVEEAVFADPYSTSPSIDEEGEFGVAHDPRYPDDPEYQDARNNPPTGEMDSPSSSSSATPSSTPSPRQPSQDPKEKDKQKKPKQQPPKPPKRGGLATNRVMPSPSPARRKQPTAVGPNQRVPGRPSYMKPGTTNPNDPANQGPEMGAGTGEVGAGEGMEAEGAFDPQDPFADPNAVELDEFGNPIAEAPRPERRLLFIRVFPESLAKISKLEGDINSPRYGQPLCYNITLHDPNQGEYGSIVSSSPSSTVGVTARTQEVEVHWTRVIHITDNRGSSEIFGTPRMEPVLNNILGLQKLYCGSPEMYWKGAFFGLSIESHPDLGVDVQFDEDSVRGMENYMNGLQRYLNIVGASIKTLAPQVVDPTPMIAVQLQAIAIKLGIPMRKLMGSERGEMASTQDDADWDDEIRERQKGYITPCMVVPLVDRLIHAKVLTEPQGYSVHWPDLKTQTDTEKANVALTRTQALVQYATDATAYMTPLDYLITILKIDEAEAAAIIERAKQEKEIREAENIAKGLNPDGTPKMEMAMDEDGNPVVTPSEDGLPNRDAPPFGQDGPEGEGSDLPGNAGHGKKGPPIPPHQDPKKKPIEQSNVQK